MLCSSHTTARREPSPDSRLNLIRTNIARSLIGRTVDLVQDARTITHGTITDVLTRAGTPKLVVNRMEFDLSQILTVTPTACN